MNEAVDPSSAHVASSPLRRRRVGVSEDAATASVKEDKTGVVDDDDIGLTGAHEGGRSHGIAQRDSRIDVTADER